MRPISAFFATTEPDATAAAASWIRRRSIPNQLNLAPPAKTPTKKPADNVRGQSSVLVAGARYAQRCPVEFGVPMDVVIAA